jgi:hypothetical protein
MLSSHESASLFCISGSSSIACSQACIASRCVVSGGSFNDRETLQVMGSANCICSLLQVRIHGDQLWFATDFGTVHELTPTSQDRSGMYRSGTRNGSYSYETFALKIGSEIKVNQNGESEAMKLLQQPDGSLYIVIRAEGKSVAQLKNRRERL